FDYLEKKRGASTYRTGKRLKRPAVKPAAMLPVKAPNTEPELDRRFNAPNASGAALPSDSAKAPDSPRSLRPKHSVPLGRRWMRVELCCSPEPCRPLGKRPKRANPKAATKLPTGFRRVLNRLAAYVRNARLFR